MAQPEALTASRKKLRLFLKLSTNPFGNPSDCTAERNNNDQEKSSVLTQQINSLFEKLNKTLFINTPCAV